MEPTSDHQFHFKVTPVTAMERMSSAFVILSVTLPPHGGEKWARVSLDRENDEDQCGVTGK